MARVSVPRFAQKRARFPHPGRWSVCGPAGRHQRHGHPGRAGQRHRAGFATPGGCWNGTTDPIRGGYNVVEATETCTFGDAGNQTGVALSVYEPADFGCRTVLPDGSCVPVAAIDQDIAAADEGSCAEAMVSEDAREVPRPFLLPDADDADDGCDAGAFEATDADGDGTKEAADCAPEDGSVALSDRCGVCGGDDSACLLFEDGFESGGTSRWSSAVE